LDESKVKGTGVGPEADGMVSLKVVVSEVAIDDGAVEIGVV
jgi:hypothetical protein